MAIEILTEPQDPVVSGDWTNLLKISQAGEVPELSLLTGWESVGAVPAAKQGAFIRHAANTYQIKDSNYTILGSTAAGINYIIASASGGVMTLTWSQDITGFSYDATNRGIYDSGGDQVIRDVLYIDGTDYIRGYASGMGFEIVQLADSSIYSATLTLRGDVSITGDVSISGDIEPLEGDVMTITNINETTQYIPEAGWFKLQLEYIGTSSGTSDRYEVFYIGMVGVSEDADPIILFSKSTAETAYSTVAIVYSSGGDIALKRTVNGTATSTCNLYYKRIH